MHKVSCPRTRQTWMEFASVATFHMTWTPSHYLWPWTCPHLLTFSLSQKVPSISWNKTPPRPESPSMAGKLSPGGRECLCPLLDSWVLTCVPCAATQRLIQSWLRLKAWKSSSLRASRSSSWIPAAGTSRRTHCSRRCCRFPTLWWVPLRIPL